MPASSCPHLIMCTHLLSPSSSSCPLHVLPCSCILDCPHMHSSVFNCACQCSSMMHLHSFTLICGCSYLFALVGTPGHYLDLLLPELVFKCWLTLFLYDHILVMVLVSETSKRWASIIENDNLSYVLKWEWLGFNAGMAKPTVFPKQLTWVQVQYSILWHCATLYTVPMVNGYFTSMHTRWAAILFLFYNTF